MRHRLAIRTTTLLAALLLLAACAEEADEAGDEVEETPTEEETATDEPTEEEEVTDEPTEEEDATEEEAAEGDGDEGDGDEVTVEVAETDLGEHLVDGEGLTLYLFTEDEQAESVCYDSCAENWPPLVADGDAAAGDGVDEALLGTTTRDDGSEQITYDDWPLYYWNGDESPGDVNGQGIQDVWFVVAPDGEPITEAMDESAEADDAGSSTGSGAMDY